MAGSHVNNNCVTALVVYSGYNIEGKITECWLVETEGIFS